MSKKQNVKGMLRVTPEERDAILAGLRVLQEAIMTHGGALRSDLLAQIDSLCERVNS